jgi:hypothetical protein
MHRQLGVCIVVLDEEDRSLHGRAIIPKAARAFQGQTGRAMRKKKYWKTAAAIGS